MTTIQIATAIATLLLGQTENTRPCDTQAECVDLVVELVDAIETAAAVVPGVDAERLAIIAFAESGFDRDRDGTNGWSFFGLNPKQSSYRDARAWCRISPEHCALAQAVAAARHLAEDKRRCKTWEATMRAYGSGKCMSEGGEKYLRYYITKQTEFRRAAR